MRPSFQIMQKLFETASRAYKVFAWGLSALIEYPLQTLSQNVLLILQYCMIFPIPSMPYSHIMKCPFIPVRTLFISVSAPFVSEFASLCSFSSGGRPRGSGDISPQQINASMMLAV